MQEMRRLGSFFAARSAVIVGDVRIGADSSVWHHCVLRGDVAPIRIGERVNIQDGADEVVIGHRAVVHSKRVGRRSLIGIGAAVLDDSEIGEGCLIAAGAVVPPGTIIPPRSVVMGMPGKVVRAIRDEERAYIDRVVIGYVELARRHAAGEFPPIGA